MPDTPVVAAAAPVAAGATGLGLTAIGAVGGPVGAAIGAGVGALITLIGDIGSGRRTANTFTGKGGPQQIINSQLAAISSSDATTEEKQQATQLAWTQFLKASNDFAAQGKEQAQVAKQAIFQTPTLTQTVQSLGGFDPLDKQYTSMVSPSIPGATKQSGVSIGQFVAPVAAGVGGAYAGSQIYGANSGTAVGSVDGGGGGLPAGVSTNEDGNLVNADGTLYSGASAAPAGTTVQSGGNGAATTGGGTTPPATNSGSSLLSRLFPTLVTAGTSLVGGVIGSNAANNAASVQADAANKAAQLNATAAANSLDFQKQVFQQQQKNIQPWIDAGTGALKSIADINANPYKLPTAEEALQTPGLQFQLQQGQKALEAYERQNGTLISGKAIKDINSFAQGTAEQGYGNLVNQQLAARNANLAPLESVAGLGQTSAAQINNTSSNAANLNTSTQLQSAQNVGNQQTSAAAATASGYVGGANSWLNSLSQIGNAASGQISIAQLAQLLNKQPAAA